MHVILHILWIVYVVIQVWLLSFLLQPYLLLLIYGFAKPISTLRKTRALANQKNYQFAIIITSHQETNFIPPIVDSLIKQVYPHFRAYVVADDCDISGLHFDDPRIILLRPPEALHNKTRSIRYALERFHDTDEVLVIFDPDNLVHPRFLEILNRYYNRGFRAVQGKLFSKNVAGTYEQMDNVGVIFNNFIDRDMRALLGLSGNIWGSGVSVDRKLYEEIIYDARSHVGGFDKRMQAEIAKRIPQIGYAPDAVLYDEKVDDPKNLEKQRNRWIRAYFKFTAEAFDLLWTGIRRMNFNLTYFGYNLTRPPYFLQLTSAAFFIVINYFVSPLLCWIWVMSLILFVLSFFMIVMINGTEPGESRGVWFMPLFFYHQLMAFLRLRRSKSAFLKTEHTKIVYIDDLLKHGSTP